MTGSNLFALMGCAVFFFFVGIGVTKFFRWVDSRRKARVRQEMQAWDIVRRMERLEGIVEVNEMCLNRLIQRVGKLEERKK